MRAETTALVACLLSGLALVGCADRNTAVVEGTVTYDGKEITDGTIRFTPANGKAPTAGGPIKNGRYSVRVPLGKMKVAISAPGAAGKRKVYNTPNSPEMSITEEALPPRFNDNTQLLLEVQPGTNDKDFALTSK